MKYPSDPNVLLNGGKFTDGNPSLGIPASRDPASHLNAITDEIVAVITNAGLTPNEADTTQLRQAIETRLSAVSSTLTTALERMATTALSGRVELATQLEMDAGTDTARVPAVNIIATYVAAQIAALVAASPTVLDTLNELAAALGNDPNFATTITNALAEKEPTITKNTAFNKNFGTTAGTVSEGNHGHSAASIGAEPAFTKNTAFNKNFGSTAGTVPQGNHHHDSAYLKLPDIAANAALTNRINALINARFSVVSGVLDIDTNV